MLDAQRPDWIDQLGKLAVHGHDVGEPHIFELIDLGLLDEVRAPVLRLGRVCGKAAERAFDGRPRAHRLVEHRASADGFDGVRWIHAEQLVLEHALVTHLEVADSEINE